MKLKLLTSAALLILGSVAANAQTTSYTVGDLVATFENSSGNDLEINLGLYSGLSTTAGAVTDFGNVSSLLSSAGLTTSTAFSVIGAIDSNSIAGGASVSVPYALGTVTALPQTLVFTQNSVGVPSYLGSTAAAGTAVYSAIGNVGGDIATSSPSTSGVLGYAVVNASADSQSYTNQIPGVNLAGNLQTTTPGASNYLYLLTSTTPGVSGKGGANEGPYNNAVELGYFSVSSGGELTFTAIPEPSTYAAILGALTLGVAAFRRRRSAIV